MKGIPAELSCTELALLLGLKRKTVDYRMRHGTIPSRRVGSSARGKRVVFLSDLREKFPELYDALILRSQALDEDDFDDVG